MKVRLCAPDSDWYCAIQLDHDEWPPTIYDDDSWLQRPIYRWPQDNTRDFYSFSYYGHILFKSPVDVLAFRLRWDGAAHVDMISSPAR